MNPFVIGLLLMNLGASGWFICKGDPAWGLVYFGAGLIQVGCLWVNR